MSVVRANAEYRYAMIKPASVCVGDIVELQISIIMVPIRDNKFKATMVLRSILVLDRTYTQVLCSFIILASISQSIHKESRCQAFYAAESHADRQATWKPKKESRLF